MDIIEYLLGEEESLKKRRFKIVKELLFFMGENNGFKITDRDIVNIEKITSNFEIEKSNIIFDEFIDSLINIFSKIVYYYENGKFDRFNFILKEEIGINKSLKEWICKNKISILNICEYYSKSSLTEKRELIFSNNYLEVIKLYKNKGKNWGIPKENNDSIEIKISLKGEIYYKNGLFLKEREYIITGPLTKLDKYKLLKDEAILLIIRLKKEFLNKIKIKELLEIKHQTLTIDEKNMKKLVNNSMFKDEFTFFVDMIIILLEVNGLVDSSVLSITLLLKDEEKIEKIIKIIDKNITLPEEEIKNKVLEEIYYSNKKIDEIIYRGTKLTLKKYILREKTKYIIEEYMNDIRVDFEFLLQKYNYSNIKNLRYNIKNFYNISIKDIKRLFSK